VVRIDPPSPSPHPSDELFTLAIMMMLLLFFRLIYQNGATERGEGAIDDV